MNEKNYDYLKDQVMYTGFGEAMEGELRQNMEQLKPEFKMNHEAFYGNDKVSAELNFKKSEQSDLYFFNSYKAQLQKEGSNEFLEQTFYINKGNNITLKEAYNLMEGRSVYKELTNKDDEKYNTWLQLDFKNTDAKGNFKINHYHENYGFNLEATLGKNSIKELNTPKYKDDLISSLKKGNLQSVTFLKGNKEMKQFIEANPQFKTITVYDSNLKRLDTRQKNTETIGKGESKEQRKSQKESPENSGEEVGTEQKKKRSKKPTI